MSSLHVDFDFNSVSSAALDTSAHSIFKAARAKVPFLRRQDGAYLILRADDVESLMSDVATRQVEGELLRLRGLTKGPVYDVVTNSMLYSNGKTHRDRRSPLTRQFAFRLIQELRPKIRNLCHELLDRTIAQGRMEIRSDYASPLPAYTIASILGLDGQDVPYFADLVYRSARIVSGSWTADDMPDIAAALDEMTRYVGALIEDRRAHPRDDFLSAYISAVDAAGELSAFEEIMQIVTVIVAGSDTTRAAMVIQVSLLLQHPDQLAALRHNPELIPSAVLEALRFEPAVGSVTRFVTQEIELDGHKLPAGAVASLMTMSAMRDERRFDDPDTFDITRGQPRWHPAFGAGAHRCLGEALAKLELEEGLVALLSRVPNLRAVSEYPEIEGHAGIRRVGTLEIAWDASS